MRQGGIKFIGVLRRALPLLACFVFFWSVVSPFYRYVPSGFGVIEVGPCAFLYWSFTEKMASLYFYGAVIEQKWFLGYWFGNFHIEYFGFFLIHPAMFVAQVATIVTGIFSVLKPRKTVAAVSVAACLTTLVLMVYQNLLASDTNLEPYCYQPGYWLTWLSLVLFTVNFLFTLTSHQPKTASTLENKTLRNHAATSENV
jgi:hypothetical protein